MTTTMRFIGYDRDGDKVYQDARGRVGAATNLQEAIEGRREWRQAGLSLDEVGEALENYNSKHGPITKEPPR